MSEATKAYYAKHYGGGYNRQGPPVIVPDDIVRLDAHEPCKLCGVRPDVACRHRRWF